MLLRTASMEPDAGHLHSLTFRALVMRGHSAHAKQSVKRANARVAPRLWLHGAICLAGPLALYNSTPALIGFTVLYAGFYVARYRALARGQGDGPPTGPSRHLAPDDA